VLDIIGKAVEQPIYNLLGGKVHERLRSYTYLYPAAGEGDEFYHDADRSAARAAEYVAQGFTGLKFDPTGDSRRTIHGNPRRRRSNAPPVGASGSRSGRTSRRPARRTHGQFTTAGAIRLGRQLEPFDPLWFEEPVPARMPEQMAIVARGTSIPIATGERLTTKYEFARVLATGAANIIQMNLGRVGGILEAKKVAAWRRCTTAQSRRTFIAARWSVPLTSRSPPARPIS